jgi:HD-GYP domain-containing protein (c-di-GMP phosphodiesterase class II)
MQRHTELSSVAVTTIENSIDISALNDPDSARHFLQVLRDITEGHHERWDGKGYPRGLAEESIPLAARIVAVIDTYESLLSDRPYRAAMVHQQAVFSIAEASGTQFDARIVDSFMAVAAEFAQENPG